MEWAPLLAVVLSAFAAMAAGGIFLLALLARIDKALDSKLEPFEKKLNAHITETNKKIQALSEGQEALSKGQARLEEMIKALAKAINAQGKHPKK